MILLVMEDLNVSDAKVSGHKERSPSMLLVLSEETRKYLDLLVEVPIESDSKSTRDEVKDQI